MATKRHSTEVRQVELADAALELIGTRGIHALTTRTLATHLGLSSGALFRHFATLDDLLDAVVGRVEEVLSATYPSPELAPAERLARFVENRSVAVRRQLGVLRLVQSEQFRLALPRDGSRRLAQAVEHSRRFIQQALADGQRAGEFRVDLELAGTTLLVMGAVQALATAPREAAEAARATLFQLLSPVDRSTQGARHEANRPLSRRQPRVGGVRPSGGARTTPRPARPRAGPGGDGADGGERTGGTRDQAAPR